MSTKPTIDVSLRDKILSHPDVILDDADVMHALIAANEKSMGGNVVDLRGIAMDRLETRLSRLEDTHRSVIAAAYENLHGTRQIHRAILRLLEARDMADFLQLLGGDVAEILQVDAILLVLEEGQISDEYCDLRDDPTVIAKPAEFIESYLTGGRSGTHRHVVLRAVPEGATTVRETLAPALMSEACLTLHAAGPTPLGLIVMESADPRMFGPQQGTDLLEFFAGVCERLLRNWLT